LSTNDQDDSDEALIIQAIEEAAAEIERGDYVDGMEFANELLARREAATKAARRADP